MSKASKQKSGIGLRYRKDTRLYHLMLLIPVLILFIYPFLQKYFTAGLTLGSVKE